MTEQGILDEGRRNTNFDKAVLKMCLHYFELDPVFAGITIPIANSDKVLDSGAGAVEQESLLVVLLLSKTNSMASIIITSTNQRHEQAVGHGDNNSTVIYLLSCSLRLNN